MKIRYFTQLLISVWAFSIAVVVMGITFYCTESLYIAMMASSGVVSLRAITSIITNKPRNFPIISAVTEGIIFVLFFLLSILFFRTLD